MTSKTAPVESAEALRPLTKDPTKMTNDEFANFVYLQMMDGWIPTEMYLRMFPTETAAGIASRVKRKRWIRGVHYNRVAGTMSWVNLKAIRCWAAGIVYEQTGVDPL
jgi:hypothetical protein